ncbi:hypothetical protein DFJ58DRAFT_845859 [Suillus subalutaceus]|uniref:uncharacterized protein n=1 Tax=Suillus subalutaceus TaxID=48586 RepID=UPI001B8642B2|nr:uncharacterized protein DFJ58DRAFT_845859 [Suillus subalutaceus]KAG1839049.1 hypothetical protein DFJ58DRAFT_845859 [Suillus subalutaceus]
MPYPSALKTSRDAPPGKVVQLPREIMSEYVQPYFESKARALRAVWSVKSGQFESPAATGNRLNARSRGKISTIQTPLQPKKKWRKAEVEWKGQWIVINHGTLSLQGFIRSSFELYTFQGKEFMASCVSTSSLPMSLPSSPIAEDWKTDVQIEATDILSTRQNRFNPRRTFRRGDDHKNSPSFDYNPEDICREKSEWFVPDLLDDHGTQFNSHPFSNILRILHRHTSHPISSSSLPTSSIITVADYWNNVSYPALTPFVYSSPYNSLPYPEWLTKTVQTTCKCLGGLRTRQLAP